MEQRITNTNVNGYLRAMFLDYFNNYLTVAKFAEHNEISEEQANQLIEMGRVLHEQHVQLLKGNK